MKNTKPFIALLSCLILAPCYTAHVQSLAMTSEAQAPTELVESPRLRQLKTQVAGGDRSAIRRFWEAMATEHTPLLDTIPNEPEKVLVTFLWRAGPGTTAVTVAGRQMTRLLDTDLWFTTLTMDRIPIFYSFFPVVTGQAERRSADPLNPHRFVMPAEVQATIPPDLRATHSQWLETSMLIFRENPAAHWAEAQSGTLAGRVEMFAVEDKQYARNRRVWVYTPPNYNPKSSLAYRLLICFDGVSYLSEIPTPTILSNLLAADEIWPTIAVMVDNGAARAAAEDLDNHAAFADFMSKDLMPWVRKNWRVSTDPAHTILCGSSRGGLGAAYVAWKHPETFGNVLAQSGAFWRGSEGGMDEPEWLTKQFKKSPKLDVRFYLEVGALETGRTPGGPVFVEANQRLHQVLVAKGYKVRYLEVGGARHDPVHWRVQLADGILYLAGKHSK